MAAELQSRLQTLSQDFQTLQQELQSNVASRQRLEGQMRENVGVQKELDNLGEDETIYKLVGPVLLKQDKDEADATIKGRIDFIGKETTRMEDLVKETQQKLEKKKAEIIQLQAAASQGAGQAGDATRGASS